MVMALHKYHNIHVGPLKKLVLFFNHVGPRAGIQVIKLGKHLYLLSISLTQIYAKFIVLRVFLVCF